MRTILLNSGWEFWYMCFCGGSERQSYRHKDFPGYEIQVRPVSLTFMVISKGQVVSGPYQSYYFEKQLKGLGIWKENA